MSIRIGVVRLRSSLSITDKKLQSLCDQYLSRCNPDDKLIFDKPNKDLMNVFFVQTGGSEIYFKDAYLSYPEPYLILARKENNSLAASMEIVSFLQNQNKKAFLLFGEPEEVGEKLYRFARFYEAKKKLSSMKLGVIGEPSDWLIASHVDPIALKKKWGVTLVNVPYRRLLAEIKKGDISDDPKIVALSKKSRRKDDLRFSLIIYTALKNICRQYGLDGFTLRCFDLVKKYQQTACLGFGLLNDELIVSGCEGDVPAMLSMVFAKALWGEPAFMANPATFDFAKRQATYAHCTVPLSMCEDYRLDTHFESDHGIGIAGTMKKESITCFKIKPDLSSLRAKEGKIIGTPFKKNMCRTQIDVAFDEPIEEMIAAPFGNHMVFVYGNRKEELKEFFEYLG